MGWTSIKRAGQVLTQRCPETQRPGTLRIVAKQLADGFCPRRRWGNLGARSLIELRR